MDGLADFIQKRIKQIVEKTTEKARENMPRRVETEAGALPAKSAAAAPGKKDLNEIPLARRNRHLAGKEHPKTGVPFNEKGYPIFDSAYDVDLPDNLRRSDVTDTAQFKYATQQLKQEIADNPAMADQFTQEQLDQINSDSPKIDGYTWHHNENGVTLQMVDQTTHALTGHDGGRAHTGGGP